MKQKLLTIWVLLAGLFSGGCALFCDVAEFRELNRPVVEYRQFQEGPALHVAGQVRRTAGNAVESVRQLKDGRSLHVEVLVSPFERDGTGNGFQTDIFLENIDYITFGNDRTLLWRRNPGEKTLPSKAKPIFKREE